MSKRRQRPDSGGADVMRRLATACIPLTRARKFVARARFWLDTCSEQYNPNSFMHNTTGVPYLDGLYRYAMAITRNPAEAEDLVQETYVRAIRAMGSLSACTNHKSWLFTILRNLRINQLRRLRSAPQIDVNESAENVFVETSRDPHAHYVGDIERERW